MAIAVIQDFDGATLDEYDTVIAGMGITPGGEHSNPSCLFHWVAQTDTGIRVVDVWESRERFEQFITEEVIPLSREAGFPNPPRNSFHEVHAYFH